MKIVTNLVFGGFGLSDKAVEILRERGYVVDKHDDCLGENGFHRDNKDLVEVVELLGSKAASGMYALLHVEEIPDDATTWYISEYDGVETIREGRSW